METCVVRETDTDGNRITERNSFEKLGSNNYYISIFEPAKKTDDVKLIIICESLWDEQERTLSFNTKLGRILASEGYTVVRFDYAGSGNSDGDNNNITFNSLASDLKHVIDWCGTNYTFAGFEGLICERIACHVAFRNQEVTKLFKKNIFIHPIQNLRHYLNWNFVEREVINVNAFSGKSITKAELLTRMGLEDEVNLNGYTFNTSFVNEMMNSKELCNENLPENNSLYIFDESFLRVKRKWEAKVDKLNATVVKMNSNVSNWDREDLMHDHVFFKSILSPIREFLKSPV